MFCELSADKCLEERFEGAKSPRQYKNPVSEFEQSFAAFSHGVEHFKFIADIARLLKVYELGGRDAYEPAASLLAALAECAHEPDASAAEYDGDTTLGER